VAESPVGKKELDVHDSNIKAKIDAKETFETVIPVTPTSGSYGEKFKQMIIGYEIVRGFGAISVAAGATNIIDIIPPTGEIWLISGGNIFKTTDAPTHCALYDAIGAITYWFFSNAPAEWEAVGSGGLVITDPDLYLRFHGKNIAATAINHLYVYTAFKIKSSSIQFAKTYPTKELLNEMKAHLNPHSINPSLPDYLTPLEKYAFIDSEGQLSILLEKDTPLRKDKKGNIIEKRTSWVWVKDFERLFGDLIADTTKRPLMTYIRARSVERGMGWEKYIDKWREEGIEF